MWRPGGHFRREPRAPPAARGRLGTAAARTPGGARSQPVRAARRAAPGASGPGENKAPRGEGGRAARAGDGFWGPSGALCGPGPLWEGGCRSPPPPPGAPLRPALPGSSAGRAAFPSRRAAPAQSRAGGRGRRAGPPAPEPPSPARARPPRAAQLGRRSWCPRLPAPRGHLPGAAAAGAAPLPADSPRRAAAPRPAPRPRGAQTCLRRRGRRRSRGSPAGTRGCGRGVWPRPLHPPGSPVGRPAAAAPGVTGWGPVTPVPFYIMDRGAGDRAGEEGRVPGAGCAPRGAPAPIPERRDPPTRRPPTAEGTGREPGSRGPRRPASAGSS